MSTYSRVFGKKPSAEGGSTEPLVPTPVPALAVLLLNLEKQKGSPLTEAEALEARDKAACIMLPLSQKRAMDQARGYRDIDPENVWEEWLAIRDEDRERDS